MSTHQPLVSVLINNYNYASFVAEAVESALHQDYPNIEVVVVDDGSKDDSISILKEFGDRIRLIAKPNGGQASAFNAGFTASTGDIICLLDADDVMIRTKASRVVELLEMKPEVGWCFDEVCEVNSESLKGRLAEEFVPAPAARLWDAQAQLAAGQMLHIPTATSGLSFKRDFLAKILPMPEEIRITSDNFIKIASLRWSPGWLLSEPITLQRIHGNNAYTQQRDKRKLRAHTTALTAIALHEKSPDFTPLAASMLSDSLGPLWALGGVNDDLKHRTNVFRKQLGIVDSSRLFLTTGLKGLRSYVGAKLRQSGAAS